MRRCAGFTLLEVCLAVAIVLILTAIAVPSVHAVLDEQKLHRTYENFDAFVARAQVRSVQERRTMALVWRENAIEMVGGEKKEGEPEAAPEQWAIGEGQTFKLERPAAMGSKPPAVWTFWRSGACEPATITYEGPEGMWKVRYDALNARRTILEEERR